MGEAQAPLSSIGALDRSLFEAKLSVPTHRQGAVSRGALIRAGRASAHPVVAVTAPAGYGKSTLLAEWAHLEDRPVAWVSLDTFDDDPAALLFALASAYERASPDRKLTADMRGFGVSALGRAAPRLAAAFGSRTPAVRPDAGRPARAAITGLPRRVERRGRRHPPGSQLVAASREEQPHVPRLRVSGEVLEFGADDLPSTRREHGRSSQMHRSNSRREQRAEVLDRTEGWPAGLYLAALIARENTSEAAGITGADRYVADYLYRESMASQSEDVQRFLRRTAVLDQLSRSALRCAARGIAAPGATAEPGSHEPLRDPDGPATRVVSLPRPVSGVPAR